MGTRDLIEQPMEAKACAAVIEELERQASTKPEELVVYRQGDGVVVRGEIDVDAVVMVVIGAMAGGP